MRKVPGLRTKGDDPGNAIMDEDATQEEVYRKYGTHRGSRGAVVYDINDAKVRFSTRILSRKMLRKCDEDECRLGVIIIVE
jgi:hypothetical protein